MDEKGPEIGLRYCGGCNPRYDRVAAVDALKAQCPAARFVPAGPAQCHVLLLCGCKAQCVTREDLDPRVELCILSSPEELERAAGTLKRWTAESKGDN